MAPGMVIQTSSSGFFIDGEVYYEGVNLTQEEFFEKQACVLVIYKL